MDERRTKNKSTVPEFNFNLTWEDEVLSTSYGETLYLGRWRVGRVQQSINARGLRSDKWTPVMFLPGLNPEYESFMDVESAKTLLESVVSFWLSKIDEKA